MKAFTIVWLGQLVSLIGTAMTQFALPIYVFGETGRVRELALLGLAFMLPLILMSPLAGAIVDRSNRKLMMIISDLASGLMTIVVLILFQAGVLEIWHLFITAAISGAFQAFQWPAFSAAISVMLPKTQYGRAQGMLSLAESGSGILAPLFAGAMLAVVGLQMILVIDIITFLFAIGALAVVHIPDPPRTGEGKEGEGSLLRESFYGFQYIWRRPSLFALQLIFFIGNFFATLFFVTLPAMILARTDGNELAFGTIQSAGAVGAVVGALLMSAWGGPKRLIHGVLAGWLLSGLLGIVLMGLGQAIPVWIAASLMGMFFVPIINGSNQAIWKAKVAPDVQGRVFSIRRLIAAATAPLAALVAIPLSDNLLGPAMMEGGALADTFNRLVGVGPGAGISLMYVFAGLAIAAVALSGYAVPFIRNVEDILPDHEAVGGDIGDETGVENTPTAAEQLTS
jgi:MFS family permease